MRVTKYKLLTMRCQFDICAALGRQEFKCARALIGLFLLLLIGRVAVLGLISILTNPPRFGPGTKASASTFLNKIIQNEYLFTNETRSKCHLRYTLRVTRVLRAGEVKDAVTGKFPAATFASKRTLNVDTPVLAHPRGIHVQCTAKRRIVSRRWRPLDLVILKPVPSTSWHHTSSDKLNLNCPGLKSQFLQRSLH